MVIDPNDALVPSATVFDSGHSRAPICTTSDDGICKIPRTSGFEIGFNKFRGIYKVKSLNSDTFVVTLAFEQMEPQIDEVWLIEGARLFVSDVNGQFDKKDFMKKLNAKKAKLLFP